MTAPRRLRITELAEASHEGRVRDHNEDRALAGPDVIAVADGMGGASAGEVAADMAVERVASLGAPVTGTELADAIERANAEIFAAAGADPAKAGMGTTITAGAIEDGTLEVAHVGDSRAYLWRDGDLEQVTNDHSVVAELVRRGTLTPEEASRHPHRNVITRALGAEEQVEVDRMSLDLRPGDVVLLCSDGLTGHLSDDQIVTVLREGGSLRAIADRLVRRTNQAGGTDNVTVVLARFSWSEKPALESSDTGDTASQTREMPVIRGVTSGGVSKTDASTRPPRILEPIRGRRRGRVLRPVFVGVAVALVLVVGAVAWIASRSYVLTESDEGTVQLDNGFPFEILGLSFAVTWQDTGISAAPVNEADPDALDGGARGQGEAVAETVGVVLAYGLPDPPVLATEGATSGGAAQPDQPQPKPGAAP